MPGAKTSGADPSPSAGGGDFGGGTTRSRDQKQKQASSEREYTPEQHAAVQRIRRCQPTAFYDILELQHVRVTVTDGEIKKAYRRLSLLTHPDKNSHPNADEAFKMVSRAFGVLGDKEKRQKFDTYGTDPDSRFANSQAQNPFSAFARAAAAGRGARAGAGTGGRETNGDAGRGAGDPGWEDEISPEEMFNRFFGGMGFGGGPQFVFDLGGGPGVRVHQYGGARPRGRPRATDDQQQARPSTFNAILSLLPIFAFFILPWLSSLLDSPFMSFGPSSVEDPRIVYDNPLPPYIHPRTTRNLGIKYFVNPDDIESLSSGRLAKLDRTAESNLVRHLRAECEVETAQKERLVRDATRFVFGVNQEKMAKARAFDTPSCNRLQTLGLGR